MAVLLCAACFERWQTLIEAHVDVKTTDNYVVRMFCIAFTKRRQDQVKANCYAQWLSCKVYTVWELWLFRSS